MIDPFLFVLQSMQFTAADWGWGEGKYEIIAKFLRAHFHLGIQKEYYQSISFSAGMH